MCNNAVAKCNIEHLNIRDGIAYTFTYISQWQSSVLCIMYLSKLCTLDAWFLIHSNAYDGQMQIDKPHISVDRNTFREGGELTMILLISKEAKPSCAQI